MDLKSVAAALGAALVLAGAPSLAQADEQQTFVGAGAPLQATGIHAGPIRIDQFQIIPVDGIPLDEVYLNFTNESQATATDVIFDLEANGRVIGTYNNRGTFSQGVPIPYNFMESLSYFSAQQPEIDVAKVTFADGTSWTNPGLVPRTLRQAAQEQN